MSCAIQWPLADPTPEDIRIDAVHICVLPPDHDGAHRCGCGARSDDT